MEAKFIRNAVAFLVQGSYRFWNVIEIDDRCSRTWRILEKGGFLSGYGKILFWKVLKYSQIDKVSVVVNSVYVMLVHFTIYAKNHNPSEYDKL